MAFRFKLGEPFDEGFRRIALEQVERAKALLQDDGREAIAVHETRKSLKRLRALLRLVRPAIGADAFSRENAQLRDIGLSLSGARDRHVLFETANKLDAAGLLGRRGIADKLRQSILAVNGDADGNGPPPALRGATERLTEAGVRLVELPMVGGAFDVVGKGLEASYRRARRAFRAAYEEGTDEAFHNWRKGAQRHWRQMALLSRAWPAYLDARVQEARALSQQLGDDHDLAMLTAFVHSDSAGPLNGEAVAVIEAAARQRQQELRLAARPRGDRLFADKPRRLRRNIQTYWDAAVGLKELEREAVVAAPKRRRQAPVRRRTPATPKV